MYCLDPGASCVVEAMSNPIGLKVAVIYDAEPDADPDKGGKLLYQRWQVKKEKILVINGMEKIGEISFSGDDTVNEGKSDVKCSNKDDFAMAVECLTYSKPAARDAGRALGGRK